MNIKDTVLGNRYLLGGSFVGVGVMVIAGILQVSDSGVQAVGAGVVALVVAGGVALAAKYGIKKDPPPSV